MPLQYYQITICSEQEPMKCVQMVERWDMRKDSKKSRSDCINDYFGISGSSSCFLFEITANSDEPIWYMGLRIVSNAYIQPNLILYL